ncbi:MAG: uroporphyrinogen decarboxylase family protein [Candidatus Latescibacterota bacterium]
MTVIRRLATVVPMDSRERTFLALDFEEPDRVPIDLWMSSGFERRVAAELGKSRAQLLDELDVDLRYIEGPGYVGPPLRQLGGGVDEDLWGVRRQRVTVPAGQGWEAYHEVAWSPLAACRTVEEVEAYAHWPSPDWFDYGDVARQCRAVREAGRVAVFMGDRLNRVAQLKPAMYLRGVEQILVDMAEAPELAAAIIGRIRRFYEGYAERLYEAAGGGLDLLLMGDDFGAQTGPLVSPRMWQTFLQAGFAAYAGQARARGVRVMHHTCGAVQPLIPLMLDSGLEVLQSLQPEAADMEPATLKSRFGDRLAFHGGISIQRTLPFGTPAQVRSAVRRCVEALAPGGGYILGTSHNLQADTPLANAQALWAAYREYGTYA